MQTVYASEQVYPGTPGLTAQEVISITSNEPNPEERNMLDCLKGIEGLILESEALALFRICKRLPDKAKILEIGSYQGGSTLAIGHAIKNTGIELYCLDPWATYSTQSDFANFEPSKVSDDFRIINNFISNTAFVADNLRMLRGNSSDFAQMLAGMGFDFIFIDGAHDYQSVRNDIKLGYSAIKPGGILSGHDFQKHWEGVVRAVTELVFCVPSIKSSQGYGVIRGTTTWFGVIPEPLYEYTMTDISDLMNAGLLMEALIKAEEAYAEFNNVETLKYIIAIKSEINRKG